MFAILAPIAVTGFICLGIFKTFELFVRRKERIMFIEKLTELPAEKLSELSGDRLFPTFREKFTPMSFISLRIGALLLGIGLGLLVGYFIAGLTGVLDPDMWEVADDNYRLGRVLQDIPSLIFGSSVLLFGGLSLVVAFVIERRIIRNDREKADKE